MSIDSPNEPKVFNAENKIVNSVRSAARLVFAIVTIPLTILTLVESIKLITDGQLNLRDFLWSSKP